ncbi:Rmd8p, partial [Ascoidea rubescens DSM 1968]
LASHNHLAMNNNHQNRNPFNHPPNNSKYKNISISKILQNSSDIPSSLKRIPNKLYNNHLNNFNNNFNNNFDNNPNNNPNRLIGSLPIRTSKTSQKLVLIPDVKHTNLNLNPSFNHQIPPSNVSSKKIPKKTKAEKMPKEIRSQNFPRLTAYYISEEIDLNLSISFLKTYHKVSPRLYDEVLYVPYCLPLLPGIDNYRIRSNISMKVLLNNKSLIENLIDRSEKRDHHYEYYSGDNNIDTKKTNVDDDDFDPSEPQSFLDSKYFTSDSDGDEYNDSDDDDDDEEDDDDEGNDNENDSDNSNLIYYKNKTLDLSLLPKENHAEVFIFNYGVVVFWNFTQNQEKEILADLVFAKMGFNNDLSLLINSIDGNEYETENFHFEYKKNCKIPRIYNDMITLSSNDHFIKLTLSHAIAQSTKLCSFENKLNNILYYLHRLPKRLSLTGKLGLNRKQLSKKSGKFFKLRVEVNLSSSILDTPEFFWSFEPSLHPLYQAGREYLEIDERVEVINNKCKLFLEFADVIADSIAERNMSKITWIIIIIIFISLFVSCLEILVRYYIILKDK